ncbi:MAG: cupin domain-containing protein [Candidatus Pacebacteria bacterium]|nr:cupin domain-containing protein [Candidatus Paceibacterota bacterium]
MKIVNRKNIKPIEDACGKLQELYNSDNLSLSYSVITDNSTPHKHKKMEEIYFIIKGKAILKIGKEIFTIEKGDVFSIPKNEYHNIQDVEEVIELLVVTNPKFDLSDLIE